MLVYFTNTEEAPGGLYPVIRNVPQEADPVQAAVAEMLRGPTPEEYAAGCRSLFSERTTGMLNGITRSPDGATLTLDFADFREMLDISGTTPATSFGPGGVMADITWAVFKQFPTVQGLRFAFDGDEEAFWTWLAGETSEPDVFTRTDWEQV
ncbi:MAG: GerMN domain-containing protein [bacterium]